MSSKSIVDQIRHYQRDIEKCPENSERMIRCIQRLYVLPVLVQHLQETGVGRSVNSLRKYNGEVGEAAKALVTKWKAMVAAEESDDGGSPHLKESSDNNKNPPTSQNSKENGTKGKEEKTGKHESSRHSGHKRSHSSSEKTEKKSSSSADRDKKSCSDKADKSKRDSKHSKEQMKEEKHVKHSSSKESRKSKGTTEDDSDHSPSPKKRKKNCVKERRRKEMQDSDVSSEGESVRESSDRVHPDLSDDDDRSGPQESDEEQETANTSSKETSSDEGSSDQKHRKDRKQSSEHHKSKGSSHSSSSKHKEKSHHKEEKRDHKKSSSSKSHDLDKLIKENEKRVKKEKFEATYDSGGSTPKGSSSPTKHKEKAVKVKEETNNDGIDAGSGFSFADALAGLDSSRKKKKKLGKDDTPVKSSSSSSSQNKSSSSHSHKSSKSSSSSRDHSSSSSSKKDKHSSSSSSKKDNYSDTTMPDLLKKPIKMENLELDINSTLPEINPHYRPLPHVPETARRNSTNKSVVNEEEMFNMMMIKNQRTKVFSGGKSSLNQGVPSLYDLCIKLLYDNIDGLEYTGGVPYDLLKPLLKKLNPDQLFVLEHYNAYLIEDTSTLWEFHCKKDFRTQRRQDMESWRELYIRCMEEREEKLKNLTQNISQSIAASTPVRKAKLAYVDSAVKPPRNVAKKQARYGTGDACNVMKAHSAEKRLILNKAVVGGHDPSTAATTTVPAPPPSSAPRSSWSAPVAVAPNKKRKAPLMAKALQLIKGANRFKR